MGPIYTDITLSNPLRPQDKAMTVNALVDTGALHLCIPQHVANQLGVEVLEMREVTLADGERQRVPYVGPIKLTFDNRNCFGGAMVLGDLPLLGAIPMEDFDIVVHPAKLTVVVNPENPNIPGSVAR